MNKEFFKKHHYMFSFLLIATLITASFQIYFYINDEKINELYGEGGIKNDPDIVQHTDPSILEGDETWGWQDPTFFLAIFTVLFYLISIIPIFDGKLSKYRIYASSTFAFIGFGTILNTGLKFFFSRPRPDNVTNGDHPFSSALIWGAENFDDAYHSSFPSGHTSAVAMLFIISFLLLGIKNKKIRIPVVVTVFISNILLCAYMGAGRVHSNNHYPSDTLFATYFGMIYAFFFYYYIFRVSEQIKAGPYNWDMKDYRFPWYQRPRRLWEIGLLFSIVFFIIGALLFLLGIKEVMNAAFNLDLNMLTQMLEEDGANVSAYAIGFGLILIGLIIMGIQQWCVRINLARRPSEATLSVNSSEYSFDIEKQIKNLKRKQERMVKTINGTYLEVIRLNILSYAVFGLFIPIFVPCIPKMWAKKNLPRVEKAIKALEIFSS